MSDTRTMKLVEVATRRRVAISMGAVTLVLFGLIALKDLKVNLLPDLSYPTLTVRTEYRGAAPEDLIEARLRDVVELVFGMREQVAARHVDRPAQQYLGIEPR